LVGGWESKTGHSTPVYKNDNETATDVAPTFIKSKYNCNAALQAYIAAGIPRSKIVMGLALYGRGWQGEFHFFFINSINYFLVSMHRSY
jgi:chitinase